MQIEQLHYVETLIYASLLFALFGVVFIPTGKLLLKTFGLHREELNLSLPIASSVIFYAFFFGLLSLLRAPAAAIFTALFIIATASLTHWLTTSSYKSLRPRRALLLHYCFYCLCSSFCSLPTGQIQNASPATLSSTLGLPIDNLIPYNTSRLISAQLNLNSLEVVPLWRATDRGPLAALANSVVFAILGLEERGHWLLPTAKLFFVYQSLFIFLNGISLLLVWELCQHHSSQRAASYATLIAGSSYFFFVNWIFTWPKLLSAVYILLSLSILDKGEEIEERKRLIGSGVLFAGALLSHNSAIFCLCALTMVSLIRALIYGFAIKKALVFALALSTSLAPWQAYKLLHAKSSPRLLYLHLFCNRDEKLAELPLLEAAKKYLNENSLASIFKTRLDNLLYPFNFLHPKKELKKYWDSPYEFIEHSSHLSFYQLFFAVGALFFPLFLVALCSALRDPSARAFLRITTISYISLLPAIVAFGCPISTWNHHWAYATYLCTVVQLGLYLGRAGPLPRIFAHLALLVNCVVLVHCCYFSENSLLFLHTPNSFVYLQLVLFLVFATISSYPRKLSLK